MDYTNALKLNFNLYIKQLNTAWRRKSFIVDIKIKTIFCNIKIDRFNILQVVRYLHVQIEITELCTLLSLSKEALSSDEIQTFLNKMS